MVGRRSTFTCVTPCDMSFGTTQTSLNNPYLVGSNSYDRLTDTYTCPSSGYYLFTWTIGAGSGASVSIKVINYFNSAPEAQMKNRYIDSRTVDFRGPFVKGSIK